MQLLLIKINAIHSNPEYALLGKKQLEDRFTLGEWSKVRSLAKGRRVVLLLPNSEVVLNTANVPSKNKKQLHQAIPYALEDTLAEDIENLHFAIHQENTNTNDTHVAIINRTRLDLFIDLLRKKGITPHFVLPQLLAQAIQDKGWSVLQFETNTGNASEKQSVSVRMSDFSGFSCDKNLLPMFLAEQLEKTPTEEISSIITNINSDELPEEIRELDIAKTDAAIVRYESIEKALPLNLLTGFISHKKESKVDWKPWRTPLVLVSLVAATGLGIMSWQNHQLAQEQKQLSQKMDALFKETFPKSRVTEGLSAERMKINLRELKKNQTVTIDSPLPLISDIAPLLKTYKDLTLKEIRYQDNDLVLVVQSPNLTRIEAFKSDAAKKSQLKVTVKDSTTTSNKVEAILSISPLDAASIKATQAGAQS